MFAQLYKAFPSRINLDRDAIAKSMGVEGEWRSHQLGSGRSLPAVLADTISWLVNENYINASGGHPAENVTLSVKGLAAVSAIPEGLKEPIGTKLTEAAEKGWRSGMAPIGELVGSMIGSVVKSMGSGG